MDGISFRDIIYVSPLLFVGVTGFWPSPVGFPQKLQGLATTNEVPLNNMFYLYHTQQTARPLLTWLPTPALLHFYMSSIGCRLIGNQPAAEAKLGTAATVGFINIQDTILMLGVLRL